MENLGQTLMQRKKCNVITLNQAKSAPYPVKKTHTSAAVSLDFSVPWPPLTSHNSPSKKGGTAESSFLGSWDRESEKLI